MVAAALSFRIGFGVEPPERAGIAEVAARTMYGSEGVQRLAHIGAGGAVLVGTDSSTFYARGMANHVEALLIGLQRWVEVGRYEQERIEAWTRRAGIGIHRPSQCAERAFATMWRSGVRTQPSLRARRRADRRQPGRDRPRFGGDVQEPILRRPERHARPRRDFDSAQVESVVRARFGSWTQGEVAAPMPPVEQQRGGSRFVGVLGQHLEMVPLAIAYRVDRAIDENYAERLVLAEMLSNRVRLIREKLGASYGVYASLVSYEQGGAYVIRGSVDPLRAGESLRVLRDAVASLRRGEGFVEDFVRARRRVLEQRLAAASSTFDLARQLAWTDRYGLPPSFENDLAQAVAALTPNAVLKRMSAELGADHEVVVLLGKQPVLGKAFAEAGVDSAQIMKES